MAMIEVEHLQKNFVKTGRFEGLYVPLSSEKQTFEAVS